MLPEINAFFSDGKYLGDYIVTNHWDLIHKRNKPVPLITGYCHAPIHMGPLN